MPAFAITGLRKILDQYNATNTEAEQLKSVLMTEEFTVVLLGMLTMTEYIYNLLVAQEIWAALVTVGIHDYG